MDLMNEDEQVDELINDDEDDLGIEDDDEISYSEDCEDYDSQISAAHARFVEERFQQKASRPHTAPRPESPNSTKERMRCMEQIALGRVEYRPALVTPRTLFVPRPLSASAASDRRSGLGPTSLSALDPLLEARIRAQIEAAVEAGVEIPTVPITTSQLVHMGENQAATAMECAQPYSTSLEVAPRPRPGSARPRARAAMIDEENEEEEDDEEEDLFAEDDGDSDEDAASERECSPQAAPTHAAPPAEPLPSNVPQAAASGTDTDGSASSMSEDETVAAGAGGEAAHEPAGTLASGMLPARVPALARPPVRLTAQAPPAAGAAPSASMRSRALADLTDDLNSLLSSGLSGLGNAHLVPGAASSSSQPQAGGTGRASKRAGMTLGMHGHLGLSSGSCASLSRASGTSAPHLVSNATTASATPATAAATSFKSSGVGQSSSAARYSSFVAGGSGARGGGAGGPRPCSAGRARQQSHALSGGSTPTRVRPKTARLGDARRGTAQPELAQVVEVANSNDVAQAAADADSNDTSHSTDAGNGAGRTPHRSNYMEVMRVDGMRKIGEANQFARELQLAHRYRLKCDQNSAVVEVFQYKSSAKSDKPGNPEGPKLRELSVDAFLKTHQRLRKQVSAEVMQERRNGPASHMFASQTTCPDAVMLAELR
mmetsp:Transcript_35460/g.67920  ORF Transcript_35460/g.67920 Transcript_35460/m.67920 type:complete len:660 (-) Transcript_35460:224-2203(-)